MSSHKRVFLILALAVAIFGAIALRPQSRHNATTVQAASQPATVILLCTTVANLPPPTAFIQPIVENVTDSDSADKFLATITTGTTCANALQSIFNAGFSELGSAAGGSTTVAYDPGTPGVSKQIVHTTQYTLVRGEEPWWGR